MAVIIVNNSGTVLYEEEDESKFPNTNFSGALFQGVIYTGIDFSGCNLTSAMFIEATLIDCKFDGATLSATDFTSSLIRGCSFANTVNNSNLIFKGATLNKDPEGAPCVFSQTGETSEYLAWDFTAANLKNVEVKGNIHFNSQDEESFFTGATLIEVQLEEGVLLSGTFKGTTITSVHSNKALDSQDFHECTIFATVIASANFYNCKISYVSEDMSDNNYSHCLFPEGSISGVYAYNVVFNDCRIEAALITRGKNSDVSDVSITFNSCQISPPTISPVLDFTPGDGGGLKYTFTFNQCTLRNLSMGGSYVIDSIYFNDCSISNVQFTDTCTFLNNFSVAMGTDERAVSRFCTYQKTFALGVNVSISLGQAGVSASSGNKLPGLGLGGRKMVSSTSLATSNALAHDYVPIDHDATANISGPSTISNRYPGISVYSASDSIALTPMNGCDFSNSILTIGHVIKRDISLPGVPLLIANTSFRGATILNSTIGQVYGVNYHNFVGCDFVGADLTDLGFLNQCLFQGCNFAYADFGSLTLTACTFRGCNMYGANIADVSGYDSFGTLNDAQDAYSTTKCWDDLAIGLEINDGDEAEIYAVKLTAGFNYLFSEGVTSLYSPKDVSIGDYSQPVMADLTSNRFRCKSSGYHYIGIEANSSGSVRTITAIFKDTLALTGGGLTVPDSTSAGIYAINLVADNTYLFDSGVSALFSSEDAAVGDYTTPVIADITSSAFTCTVSGYYYLGVDANYTGSEFTIPVSFKTILALTGGGLTVPDSTSADIYAINLVANNTYLFDSGVSALYSPEDAAVGDYTTPVIADMTSNAYTCLTSGYYYLGVDANSSGSELIIPVSFKTAWDITGAGLVVPDGALESVYAISLVAGSTYLFDSGVSALYSSDNVAVDDYTTPLAEDITVNAYTCLTSGYYYLGVDANSSGSDLTISVTIG